MEHLPVLITETIEPFLQNHGSVYVDGTLGGGGHLSALMKAKPSATFYAFDQDPAMIKRAEQLFAEQIAAGRLVLIHENFSQMKEALAHRGVHAVDGILVDLGVSSFQIDTPERGFSFQKPGPLDMRMNTSADFTARDLVNEWSQKDLEKIFFEYGEEKFSRRIAGAIVEARATAPIEDTLALAKLVESVVPRQKLQRGKKPIHPATRVFQAIRIAVNEELGVLDKILHAIPDLLNPGGIFAAISFHSLEDRMVKDRIRFLSASCVCEVRPVSCARCYNPPGIAITRKPIIATAEEAAENPRARSAKLRVFQKKNDEKL